MHKVEILINKIKKNLYGFVSQKFRTRIKFYRIDFVETPPVFIFQMGKVGSTSVSHTLEEMNLGGRPIYHAHYLSAQGIKKARCWYYTQQGFVPSSIDYYELLGNKVRANLGKAHYSVITGVRDPIAKEISNYFELADKIDHGLKNESGSLDMDKISTYLLDRFQRFDDEESDFFTKEWFDQELKGTFGLDIFEYPFDQHQGYSIIRHDDLDLLVYQFESLQRIFSRALSELLKLEETEIPILERHNVGESKWYAPLYADIKENIVVPLEVCKKVYGTQLVRHFYSQETIDEWTKHWSRQETS